MQGLLTYTRYWKILRDLVFMSYKLEVSKNCLVIILCHVLQYNPAWAERLEHMAHCGPFQADLFCGFYHNKLQFCKLIWLREINTKSRRNKDSALEDREWEWTSTLNDVLQAELLKKIAVSCQPPSSPLLCYAGVCPACLSRATGAFGSCLIGLMRM